MLTVAVKPTQVTGHGQVYKIDKNLTFFISVSLSIAKNTTITYLFLHLIAISI